MADLELQIYSTDFTLGRLGSCFWTKALHAYVLGGRSNTDKGLTVAYVSAAKQLKQQLETFFAPKK